MKVGRYLLFDEIASGGMAAVHFGRLVGDVGFSRTVAIKRLHAAHARDPDFVTMFLDEARLAARVSHPNVVQTLDVVALKDELFLVMEYVRGESLAALVRACEREGTRAPPDVAAAIVCGALHGLHAAHEARDAEGELLGIVHRDVSPHNVLVGADGVARMLDFGIAKAVTRLGSTRDGQLKGKLAYMAPEQIAGKEATRRSDVYAAGIVLWEVLTARRCFEADTPGTLMALVAAGLTKKPSALAIDVPEALDDIVSRACAAEPEARYATARDMALALEAVGVAAPSKVGAWVESLAKEALAVRAARVAAIEAGKAESEELGAGRPSFAEIGTASMPAPNRASLTDVTSAEGSARRVRSAKSSRSVVAVAIAAAAAIAGGVWIGVTRERGVDAPVVVVAHTAQPSPSEPPSVASAAAPIEPAASPSPSPSAPAIATAEAKRPLARPTTTTAAARSSRPAPSCDPPYSLGPNGRRIPKPECL